MVLNRALLIATLKNREIAYVILLNGEEVSLPINLYIKVPTWRGVAMN